MCMSDKNIQDQVKVVGFYQPFHTRPILTPGIRICSQKWSQVNISIGYRYISKVKLLYKVKFSKLKIYQFDCRFKILTKNCQKKVSFFFLNFEWNIVKISIEHQKHSKIALLSKIGLILINKVNFDYVPLKISKKERHFLLTVFCKDFESAIRLTNFQF